MQVISTGQLRAQSISIQVSERTRCNGRCLYCISRTTPGAGAQEESPKKCSENRLRVGLNFAKTLGASHAILSGKADPTQEDPDYLYQLIKIAREYIPLVDMHTNGWILQKNRQSFLLDHLVQAGLTMITFSIVSFEPKVNREIMGIPQDAEDLIGRTKEQELLIRCSLVANKLGPCDFGSVMDYIFAAGNLGVHMVVVREIWVPEVYAEYDKEVYEWNQQNKVLIKPIEEEFKRVAKNPRNSFGLQERDPLPWGTPVFAVGGFGQDRSHGVNVTFALCDEATAGPVIKSIVHKPDGHGYRNWDHNGDILY